MFSLPGSRDPRWQSQQTLLPGQLSNLRHWLLDEGSLTRHLVRASGGNFRVERLVQGWQIPLPSERRLLGLGTRQIALVREVALLCFDQPWVFARSVIPLSTLDGPLRHLRKLNNQPLGELIFRHPGLGRSPFELSLLPAASEYIHPDLRQAESAWARRSRFQLGGKSLLVSEVFLRSFTPWPT